jgi:positive phototaxis protein PixI
MSDALSIAKFQPPPAEAHDLVPVTSKAADEQFLRLHLVPDMTVLLPVRLLTEVLTIPVTQIVPMPHMPAWVMGIYNWRGDILWMVDLGHLCGLTPWYQKATSVSVHPAVVLQVGNASTPSTARVKGHTLGLVVSRVEDIEWCDPTRIQPLPSSTVLPELVPFLRGYWWKSNGEMLAVLDGNAIIEAMPQP